MRIGQLLAGRRSVPLAQPDSSQLVRNGAFEGCRIGPSGGRGRPRCNHLHPKWTPCNRTRPNPLLFLRLIGLF